MNLRRVVITLTFLSVFAMGLRISIDSDSWWHLRTGDLIRAEGQVPLQDPFSSTRLGADWRYPSAAWISQVAISQLYQLGGPAAINLGVAATVTIALGFLYLSLSGGVFLRAFLLVLAAATSAVFWSARPHLATYLCFAIFVFFLERTRGFSRTKLLWALPLVMLFWVNSHPGFAAGFTLYAVYFFGLAFDLVLSNWGQPRTQYWSVFKASPLPSWLLIGLSLLLIIPLNPSGLAMLRYPFETLSIGVLRDFIQEWQSPNFHDGANLPFLFMVFFSLLVYGFSKRRITITDATLFVIFGAMAFLAGRNIALFALAATPALSRHLSTLVEELQTRGAPHLHLDAAPNHIQTLLNLAILAVALFTVGLKASQVLPLVANQAAFEELMPVAAVDFIKQHDLPGPLFNSYNFGGYLIWALPEQPVFIDGRTDLYADGSLETWLNIVSAKDGWQAELTSHKIRLVLIEDSWPLSQALQAEGWDKIYQDEVSILFTK